MVSLSDIKIGQKVEILSFLSSAIKCYTSRLGLEKGQIITCLSKSGAIVIQKNNQEIAIGKNLSKEIYVNVI